MKFIALIFFLISNIASASESWKLSESFQSFSIDEECSSTVQEGESISRDGDNVVITLIKRLPIGDSLYPKLVQEIGSPEVTIKYIQYSISEAPILCDTVTKFVHIFYGAPEELKFHISVVRL